MTESDPSPAKEHTQTAKAQLARLIDHTQVRAYATQTDIDELCAEAAEFSAEVVAVR